MIQDFFANRPSDIVSLVNFVTVLVRDFPAPILLLRTTNSTSPSKQYGNYDYDGTNNSSHDLSTTHPSIKDPGPGLLIGTTACCFLSVVLVPFLLRWGSQLDQYHKRRKSANHQGFGYTIMSRISEMWGIIFRRKCDSCADEFKVVASEDTDVGEESGEQDIQTIANHRKTSKDDSSLSVGHSAASKLSSSSFSSFFEDLNSIFDTQQSQSQQVMTPLKHFLQTKGQFNADDQEYIINTLAPAFLLKQNMDQQKILPVMDSSDFEALTNNTPKTIYDSDRHSFDSYGSDYRDLRICYGANAFWNPCVAQKAFNELVTLFEVDKELKRLVQLATPFTASAFLLGLNHNIYWVLISRYLGTIDLAAATMVEIFQGITGAFLGGIILGQISITSHALGMGECYVVGQYVQQAQILFTICFIPAYISWGFLVYPLTLKIGLSEEVATIAQSYIRVEMINNWMAWLLYSIYGIYEVTDHEVFASISKIMTEYIFLVGVVLAFNFIQDASLVTLAYVHILVHFFSIVWAVLYPLHKGWLHIFIPGWLCNFSLRNTAALRQLFRATMPLAFGEVMAYGEWQVLTILAAHNGQADVAAFGLLGALWETFESFTEGIGEAAVIRVGYFLGKGNPRSAKMSGYRSAMFGTVMACVVTSIFWIFGNEIPRWFSNGKLHSS